MNDPIILGIGIATSVAAGTLGVIRYLTRTTENAPPVDEPLSPTTEDETVHQDQESTETSEPGSYFRPHGPHKTYRAYRIVKKTELELQKAKRLAEEAARKREHDESLIVCECADPHDGDDDTGVVFESSDVGATDPRGRNMRRSRAKVEAWLLQLANEPVIGTEVPSVEENAVVRDSSRNRKSSRRSSRSDNSSVRTQETAPNKATAITATGENVIQSVVSHNQPTAPIPVEESTKASCTTVDEQPSVNAESDCLLSKEQSTSQEATNTSKAPRKIIIKRTKSRSKPKSIIDSNKSPHYSKNADFDKPHISGTRNNEATKNRQESSGSMTNRKSSMSKPIIKKDKEPMTPAMARLMARNYRLGNKKSSSSESQHKRISKQQSNESSEYAGVQLINSADFDTISEVEPLEAKSLHSRNVVECSNDNSRSSDHSQRKHIQDKVSDKENIMSEIEHNISKIGKKFEGRENSRRKSENKTGLSPSSTFQHEANQKDKDDITDNDFIEYQYIQRRPSSFRSSVSILEKPSEATITEEHYYVGGGQKEKHSPCMSQSHGYMVKKTVTREEKRPKSQGALYSTEPHDESTSELNFDDIPSDSTFDLQRGESSTDEFSQDTVLPPSSCHIVADSSDSIHIESDFDSVYQEDAEFFTKLFNLQYKSNLSINRSVECAVQVKSETSPEKTDKYSSEKPSRAGMVAGRDAGPAAKVSEGQVLKVVTDGFMKLEMEKEAAERS